jgi:hypothetical protein
MTVACRSRTSLVAIVATTTLLVHLGAAQESARPANEPWINAYVAGSRALEAGDLDVAGASFTVARSLAPRNTATLLQSAATDARRGKVETALAFLDEAVAAGFDDAALLEWDPDLDSLRQDARFVALVDRVRSTAKQAATPAATLSIPVDLRGGVLAMAPDGARAALGKDMVVSVVDLKRDRLIAQFAQQGDQPRRIEFTADGGRIFVEAEQHASSGQKIFTREYDLESRRRIGERPGPLDVDANFPIAPIRRFAADSTAGDGSEVTRIVDTASGNAVAQIPTADPVQIRAVAADASALLLRAWGSATVYGVDAQSGVVSSPITDAPHQLALGFVGETRNGFAVRGDGATTVHSFDAPSETRTLRLEFEPLPTGKTDPSARFIARTDRAGRVLLVLRDFADLSAYSLADGHHLWSFRGNETALSVHDFVVADDSVLIKSNGGRLTRVDLESGVELGRFTPPIRNQEALSRVPPLDEMRHELESKGVTRAALDRLTASLGDAGVRCVAAHAGEIWIGTDPASIHVFRAGESKPDAVIDFRDLDLLRTVEIGSLSISPDGALVAVGSIGFGMVAAYDRVTRSPRWQFDYGGGNMSSLLARFSADGSWLAVCGQSPRNSRIVDAKTGTVLRDLGDRGISDLRPTADPGRVLAVGDHGIEVLEVPSGRVFSRIVELEVGGIIELTPLGFVFADAPSLARVHRFVGAGSDDLATLAPQLLDLKKIRAASAGVAITLPVLPE